MVETRYHIHDTFRVIRLKSLFLPSVPLGLSGYRSHIRNKAGKLVTNAHDLCFTCSADTAINANLIS